VIAYFCYENNTLSYGEELKPADVQKMYSWERLIRTEISTLIGLMAKSPISFVLPRPEEMQRLIDRTVALLGELHEALGAAFLLANEQVSGGVPDERTFNTGAMLREAIFYGAESAYSFQYRDLAIKKYSADDNWLRENRCFSILEAQLVARAISTNQCDKILTQLRTIAMKLPEEMTLLPAYTFTIDEIQKLCGLDNNTIAHVLRSFTLSKDNANALFLGLNDFNESNAMPITRVSSEEYLIFQPYSLFEAIYDSPFYWMCADIDYRPCAMLNRGKFTEDYSMERLRAVFGDCVYRNVTITTNGGRDHGEIDVLVVYANRAIVLQAKSKRLTLEARKGNDKQLKDDFKKSVQDAYDQGYACAEALTTGNYKYLDENGNELSFKSGLKEVYILCVVSDHYPALSFQARKFLYYKLNQIILPPIVLDVFTLDAICEMLNTPLRFLSYINMRSKDKVKVMSSNELAILSYHLKYNLWVEDKTSGLVVADDFSTDLDIAMAVRRDEVPGKATPKGILTKFLSTPIGDLISSIERRAEPGIIDLGFILLSLNEATINTLNSYVNKILKLSKVDGHSHDCTMSFTGLDSGITIHCNAAVASESSRNLHNHCEKRKYTERASSWFGICLDPASAEMRFGLKLEYPWSVDSRLENVTKDMKLAKSTAGRLRILLNRPKVGNNDKCPCGSGLKYKKCCKIG